jgi:hypothetical protein
MLAKHRPDLTGSRDELLALKSDPALSKEMTAAYAGDNAGILSKSGLPSRPERSISPISPGRRAPSAS